ncbi:DivIVA domain-containing protein [candidate division KSB1 bacterium]|nr:DivIVA domain-containing protein [candidate division KSB1 bacterium]NIR68670.1 DivIVA domain-containing protein [candidate division KSB1 bacterium]NIS27159.1 DivIVA domain-containing protein [candidate division KSB1 bacterium]NIT74045.1 DivIVA domain-containing protein [candidate division KSB1 bacterium]NIU27911.1 DivIVA domain-containing protein [candidate division KSB1 bacterium]
MKLTPLDIKKQEFKKSLRGFDPVEVETFLEMVADEFENLIRERNSLSDEVLRLKTQLQDYQDVEKNLKETLMNAQQNIEDSRENSKREAEMIVREAEIKAEKIIEDARIKLVELKNELVVVKAQKDSFARRLRHLLISQLDLIEVLELDDLGFDKAEQKRLGRRKPPLKKNQEEIEFEGVDEVFPGEDDTDAHVREQDDEPLHKHAAWESHKHEEDDVEEPEDENKEEDEEKKTRISDKLIF